MCQRSQHDMSSTYQGGKALNPKTLNRGKFGRGRAAIRRNGFAAQLLASKEENVVVYPGYVVELADSSQAL